MQTVNRYSASSTSQQMRRIAIVAILLFGLSGLISGFAVGAFVRPKLPVGLGNNSNNGNATPPSIARNSGTGTTGQVQPVNIGFPVVDSASFTEKADGATTYALTVHAVDTSIDSGHGKPIHAAGITSKLWIEHIPRNGRVELPNAKLAAVDLQNPLTPNELPGGLNFSSTTPQIQRTNAQGQVTWTYSVSTTVDPGRYYLVILMDWQGKDYNWSWIDIKVEGTGN